MKAWFVLLAAVLLAGVILRAWRIEAPPFHMDEAVQAAIFQDLLEGGNYQYNPHHFHGPLPHWINLLWVRAAGHERLSDLDEWHFRLVPVVAGSLLVLAMMAGLWRHGRQLALVAGLFAATSPALVFYSRAGLHESLFCLFGFLATVSWFRVVTAPGPGTSAACGVLLALTAACKETWVFLLPGWLLAAWLAGVRFPPPRWFGVSIAGLAAFLGGTLILYGGGAGFVDFWQSFFVYETGAGHDKPWWYYAAMILPRPGWPGEPWLLLAALAGIIGWRRGMPDTLASFLGVTGVVFLLFLSFIPYKTPWLVCLPLVLLIPLAAWSVTGDGWIRRPVVGISLLAIVIWQAHGAWTLGQHRHWDSRIPLVYSPTSRDLPRLRAHVQGLALHGPIAVVGSDYWPLPWYLRGVADAGYFAEWPAPGNFGLIVVSGHGLENPLPPGEEGIWGLRENVFVKTVLPAAP